MSWKKTKKLNLDPFFAANKGKIMRIVPQENHFIVSK